MNKQSYLRQLVQNKQITTLDELLAMPYPILEPELIDELGINYNVDLVSVRRVFKQIESGRVVRYSIHAILTTPTHIGFGNGKGYTFTDAKQLAIKSAKLTFVKIRKGHKYNAKSIPTTIEGVVRNIRIRLEPVNIGTGLVGAPKFLEVCKHFTDLELRIKLAGSRAKNQMNKFGALYDAFKKLDDLYTK